LQLISCCNRDFGPTNNSMVHPMFAWLKIQVSTCNSSLVAIQPWPNQQLCSPSMCLTIPEHEYSESIGKKDRTSVGQEHVTWQELSLSLFAQAPHTTCRTPNFTVPVEANVCSTVQRAKTITRKHKMAGILWRRHP
jgi:hypothetical protein